MSIYSIASRLANILVALLMSLSAGAWAQAQTQTSGPTAIPAKRFIQWLERPWEFRYVLYVDQNWELTQSIAEQLQAEEGPEEKDRRWPTIFARTEFLPSKDKWARPGAGLSVIVMTFESDGTVSSPHYYGAPLRGRFDRLMRVSLAAGAPDQPRFDLGEWFLGFGDESTHWVPAICNAGDMRSPFSATDTSYLYGPRFLIGRARPTFGCREWANQLDDPQRPYIDITSYLPRKIDPDGPGTYIRDSIGWARFSDPKKPIIGKHENDWYCLHECPNNEKPGVIPDIKAWSQKNGWVAPRRPTRVPVFPDPPAKSGFYPNN